MTLYVFRMMCMKWTNIGLIVSVCPHISARGPMDERSRNLTLEFCTENCRAFWILFKSETRVTIIYVKNYMRYCSDLIKHSSQNKIPTTTVIERVELQKIREKFICVKNIGFVRILPSFMWSLYFCREDLEEPTGHIFREFCRWKQ
jgi:hypothetical protein